VALDRARGYEEALRDLAVGQALAGELGDATLARCQRVESCENDPARARARGAEICLGLLGQPLGAQAIGSVECLAEQVSSFGATVAPPKHRSEVSQSPRSFQPGFALVERVDRLTQQGLAALAAGHDPGGTLGHSERPRGAKCKSELELVLCEASRCLMLAERELGERSL